MLLAPKVKEEDHIETQTSVTKCVKQSALIRPQATTDIFILLNPLSLRYYVPEHQAKPLPLQMSVPAQILTTAGPGTLISFICGPRNGVPVRSGLLLPLPMH